MFEFNISKPLTLGVELELQIINRDGKDLTGLSEHILQQFKDNPYKKNIKPEITKSMLEINSGVHEAPQPLLEELNQIKEQLLMHTKDFNLLLSGGGTHPFQMWHERELYPIKPYKIAEKKYGYLTKVFTVFGMHIHIGCANCKDALYLTQAMARYVPHLIALSASSPFCQGVDTEFCSSRSNIVNLFPLSGMPPFILDWQEFCDYLAKMQQLSLVDSVNNFYWDIRPRAEFGTIEIRVCDTPLTIEKAVQIAAFTQSLIYYLLEKQPDISDSNRHELYRYNRFQASKSGFDATLVDPLTFHQYTLFEDLLKVCQDIEPYAASLNSTEFISTLTTEVMQRKNDAAWLKKLFLEGEDLKDITYLASHLFAGKINNHF